MYTPTGMPNHSMKSRKRRFDLHVEANLRCVQTPTKNLQCQKSISSRKLKMTWNHGNWISCDREAVPYSSKDRERSPMVSFMLALALPNGFCVACKRMHGCFATSVTCCEARKIGSSDTSWKRQDYIDCGIECVNTIHLVINLSNPWNLPHEMCF